MDPENQNFQKNGKKHLKILSFYKHKWQSYDVWFLRYGVQWTEFFVILDSLLPFYPPYNLKNHNLKQLKKTPRDIIILLMCTINDNLMMYGSWDMEHVMNGLFCHFGPFFALPPYQPKNSKFWKKLKNAWRYYDFTHV